SPRPERRQQEFTLIPYTTLFRSQAENQPGQPGSGPDQDRIHQPGSQGPRKEEKGGRVTIEFNSWQEAIALMLGLIAITTSVAARSEEHTSELQSRENLVCRLLLE